jgi:beta-barrel assembly-enhancing protease
MAHGIAHVALRHPTHQVSKAYVAQTGLGLLKGILGGASSNRTRGVVSAVGGLGLNALFLKFSRSAEEEADAVGAEIMARSGYDPTDMANFFETMRRDAGRNPSKFETFLSSHPAAASREAHIRGEARGIARSRVAPIGGLSAAQRELRSLPKAKSLSRVARTS